MKSKFARCAKERQDREDAIRFDAKKGVGDFFSQSTANMAANGTACHKIPQMHDMRNTDDNMHGAERYITQAKRPFMNSSVGKKRSKDDDGIFVALGALTMANAGHWAHGDTAATHDYSAPAHH